MTIAFGPEFTRFFPPIVKALRETGGPGTTSEIIDRSIELLPSASPSCASTRTCRASSGSAPSVPAGTTPQIHHRHHHLCRLRHHGPVHQLRAAPPPGIVFLKRHGQQQTVSGESLFNRQPRKEILNEPHHHPHTPRRPHPRAAGHAARRCIAEARQEAQHHPHPRR
jgi:hypothetical protein